MLSEEEVYIGTKKFLKRNGFTLIAGQPPRGVDHLPVIEIKSGIQQKKGSRDSFKPDLIALKNNKIFIIECKPLFNFQDVLKLNEILNSESRLSAFYNEIKQRNIFSKVNLEVNIDEFFNCVHGIIAYSMKQNAELPLPIEKLFQVLIYDFNGEGFFINPKY